MGNDSAEYALTTCDHKSSHSREKSVGQLAAVDPNRDHFSYKQEGTLVLLIHWRYYLGPDLSVSQNSCHEDAGPLGHIL